MLNESWEKLQRFGNAVKITELLLFIVVHNYSSIVDTSRLSDRLQLLTFYT